MLMRGILIAFARAGLGLASVLCVLFGAGSVASVASAESCPNAAFRSGPSANLPDCRAYEQVSPPAKNGGRIVSAGMGFDDAGNLLSVDLDSFASFAGIENNEGIADGGDYVAQRGESGWMTSPTVLPASKYQGLLERGYVSTSSSLQSLDGKTVLWLARPLSSSENTRDLFARADDGAINEIGPMIPPTTPAGPLDMFTYAIGVSDDMSHVLFSLGLNQSQASLGYHFWPSDSTTPGPTEEHDSLYEYVGTGNTAPMLVGLGEENKLISTCGTVLGGPGAFDEANAVGQYHNAISGDGATVYFTAMPPSNVSEACAASSPPVRELFARIDNGLPDAHTVAISEPSASDCPTCDTSKEVLASARFEGASEDGSTAFFTTTQPLLGGDGSLNIYEFDLNPPAGQPKVVRVSGGDATVSDPVADVEGVVATSEDGSHVYFAAQGVLTKTPNSRGEIAQPGANNLYVFERDAQYPAGRTEFIADLPETDKALWTTHERGPASSVTPDGRFLVFVSNADLTPDDTSSAEQVFEYDAQTDELKRVSIGQNGYNENGNIGGIEGHAYIATAIPAAYGFQDNPGGYWSHMTVSADGAYVFFQSSAGLTPQASNNQVFFTNEAGQGVEAHSIMNTYEYHGGNVYLISDVGDIGAFKTLIGTDASGRDVILGTSDSLVPQDTDTNFDIYDARVDGGFPAPAVPVECSGDGCQGPLSAAPVLLSPGSEFQAGGGNFAIPASSTAVKAKAKKTKRPKSRAKKIGKRVGKVRGHRLARSHGKVGRS